MIDCLILKEKLTQKSQLMLTFDILVLQKFAMRSRERFVLATTDRTVLDFDKFGE